MIGRPEKRIFSFDVFRVDAAERLLFKENREVPLTPKVFDTLLVFLENSSHVLTKQELMQKVWPDIFVEENNLAQNISVLRKAIGERFIQTVPKRGYRFVGEVRAPEETIVVYERVRSRIVVERTDEEDELHEMKIVSPRAGSLARPARAEVVFDAPETMYARSGDVNIAYQV